MMVVMRLAFRRVSIFKTTTLLRLITLILLLCTDTILAKSPSSIFPFQIRHFSVNLSLAKRRTSETTKPSTKNKVLFFLGSWNRPFIFQKRSRVGETAAADRESSISSSYGKIDKSKMTTAITRHRSRSVPSKSNDFFKQQIQNIVQGTPRKPGPRVIHHALYWLTALDAVQCLIANDYTVPALLSAGGGRSSGASGGSKKGITSVYSTLFYFARLRPRLLYSVGALLRALQLCTPLQRLIDPTIGVGAGINLCALMAKSRWVKPLVLGWATTKYIWVWLGASKVHGAHVPIVLSMMQKKRYEEQSSSWSPPLGYSLSKGGSGGVFGGGSSSNIGADET